MNRVRLVTAAALILTLSVTIGRVAAQEIHASHGRQVLDLLVQERFDDVAKEFNAKMAAALSPTQLRNVWTGMRQQLGRFQTVIALMVAKPVSSITSVTLTCAFEKARVNVIVSFDEDDRIAGLRFVPTQTASEPSSPPPSSRFTEEGVTVGAGGWALPGTLSLPADPSGAAVVLVHGSGPHDRDETIGPNKPFRDLAWGLADRGIAVLRYEKRTRMYPGKAAGSGTYTVREEAVEDAVLAAAALRKHPRINPKRVFVLGHSLGGTVAPRIAADDPSLAGLIIMAGSTRPIMDVAREQIAYLASLNPAAAGDQAQALEMLRRSAPESYWKDLDAYKPADAAAKLAIPMLILQGERDYQVTMADLKGWQDALAGHANVVLKSYPTLNHLFMPGEGKGTPAEYGRAGRIPDFVCDDIATWIKTQ